MVFMILLALLNGAFIGASRTLNGRLAVSIGAFGASFWNHLVGFVGLTLVLLASGAPLSLPADVPTHAYLGGVIGALYVAINSHVLPRLGTLTAIVLVISGQMITGLVIDWLHAEGTLVLNSILCQSLGVVLIVTGVYLSQEQMTSGPGSASAKA